MVSEPFTAWEALESSTAREIHVFHRLYTCTDLSEWRNASILHYTDNQAAERIITFGSRNPVIQCMVHDIYYRCWEYSIQPAAKWKGREDEAMVWADLGSRGPWNPNQEFSLDHTSLQFILGSNPITIDTMATYKNCVVA